MRTALLAAAILATLAAASAALAESPQKQAPAVPPSLGAISVDCAREAVSCAALENCQQACAFLHQCGLSRLDRDKDGIPCESLCSKPCDAPG